MIKLVVMKLPGHIPNAGFHYLLMPLKPTEGEAQIFQLMGHVIIEVDEAKADRLLESARLALNHQVEVAVLTEEVLAK